MRELREKFGFNQNRIAQVCRISASMVSQIVSGERSPGEPSLELLRMAYRDLTQPQPRKTESGTDELRQQLEYLERHNPPGFEAAKATVGALHRQAVASAASSKVVSPSGIAPASASALARRELQESQQRRKAGAPTADKRGRGRGARPGSGHKPEAPGEALK